MKLPRPRRSFWVKLSDGTFVGVLVAGALSPDATEELKRRLDAWSLATGKGA